MGDPNDFNRIVNELMREANEAAAQGGRAERAANEAAEALREAAQRQNINPRMNERGHTDAYRRYYEETMRQSEQERNRAAQERGNLNQRYGDLSTKTVEELTSILNDLRQKGASNALIEEVNRKLSNVRMSRFRSMKREDMLRQWENVERPEVIQRAQARGEDIPPASAITEGRTFYARNVMQNMMESLRGGQDLGTTLAQYANAFFQSFSEAVYTDPNTGLLARGRQYQEAEREIFGRVAELLQGRNLAANPLTPDEIDRLYAQATREMVAGSFRGDPPLDLMRTIAGDSEFGRFIRDFVWTLASQNTGGLGLLVRGINALNYARVVYPAQVAVVEDVGARFVAQGADLIRHQMEEGGHNPDTLIGRALNSLANFGPNLADALKNLGGKASDIGWTKLISAIAVMGASMKLLHSYLWKNPVLKPYDEAAAKLLAGQLNNINSAGPLPPNPKGKLITLARELNKSPDNPYLVSETSGLIRSIIKEELWEQLGEVYPAYEFTNMAMRQRALLPLGSKYQERRFDLQKGVLGGNLVPSRQWAKKPSVRF